MEVRPDLKEVEPLLHKLAQFGNVFHKNNHEHWSHLKHKEDFDRVYSLSRDERKPLEELYSTGRDLAVFMGSQLDAFNHPDLFPTLKKYVDSFDGSWIDEVGSLTLLSQAAKDAQSRLDQQIWSVGQMIKLLDSQISLLHDIRRTFDGLRESETYAFDAGETRPASQIEPPKNSTTSPTILDTIYRLAVLWLGEPKARFAKFFVIAGVASIAAPWWQPVLQQIAVKHLDLPSGFMADADFGMFWSGWVLIAIGVSLYVWIKCRDGPKDQRDA